MRSRNWFGTPRCGPCGEDNHAGCVVLVEMNAQKRRGRPHSGEFHSTQKKPQPYLWRCGCWCEFSAKRKCVDCGRLDVTTERGRCVDIEACEALWKKVKA